MGNKIETHNKGNNFKGFLPIWCTIINKTLRKKCVQLCFLDFYSYICKAFFQKKVTFISLSHFTCPPHSGFDSYTNPVCFKAKLIIACCFHFFL